MDTAANRRILFVDDEPLVLRGLQRMLRGMRSEWDMHFVDSSSKAVTDMRMPEMDGAQLLNEVMRRQPETVRIVLSGEMDQKMILKTVRSSHQYLNKPCEPDVLKLTLERAFALRNILDDSRLKRLIAGIDSLPSMPTLYLEIMEELQSPNSSFKKIGDIIARDLGMTAKILQLVNSAYFGLYRKITRTQEAVSYLGMETVKSLVLSAKIFSQFDQRKMAFFSMDKLWDHSLKAGMCAKAVATAEQFPREMADNAFMAAILHDLGKLLLAQNLPDSYRQVLTDFRRDKRRLWEVEQDALGANHAHIAAYLMGLWGMPDLIVEAIAFHHQPAAAPGENDILTAVHAADLLSATPSVAGQSRCRIPDADRVYLQEREMTEHIDIWEKACRNLNFKGVAK